MFLACRHMSRANLGLLICGVAQSAASGVGKPLVLSVVSPWWPFLRAYLLFAPKPPSKALGRRQDGTDIHVW